jgi:surface protein
VKIRKVFKNDRGTVDLGSITTGVIVLGIAGGVIAATTLGVIPFVKNNAAKSSLSSLSMAQTSHKQGTGSYGTLQNLVNEQLIEKSFATDTNENVSKDGKLCSVVYATGAYLASIKSETGKYYSITDTAPKPVEVLPAQIATQTCFTVAPFAAYNMAFTIDTRIPGCTTYEFPAASPNNLTVLWGDGSPAEIITSNYPTHTYTSQGVQTVRVNGEFAKYGKLNGPSQTCITGVQKWQNSNTTDLTYAFQNATNLTQVMEIPVTTTTLRLAFKDNATFNGNVSAWNTANVTDFYGVFSGATSFNQPIGSWNTAKATTLQGMFENAHSFNQNINTWNTSNVTNLSYTFQHAKVFNQPLDKWNTVKVISLFATFDHAAAFNQPLGTWNTANVTDMGYTFRNDVAFNQNINSWNTANVTNMHAMFFSALAYNQPLDKWNTAKVTGMGYMLGVTAFNQNISTWNTANVTNMAYTFYGAKAFNQNISGWNTGKVKAMNQMFQGATAFNQPIGAWNTANVTNMQSMLQSANSFNQNINTWNTANVTNMSYMFHGNTKFNQPLGTWNTSKVTTMQSMFQSSTVFNQNISGWSLAGNPISTDFRTGSALTAANSPFRV